MTLRTTRRNGQGFNPANLSYMKSGRVIVPILKKVESTPTIPTFNQACQTVWPSYTYRKPLPKKKRSFTPKEAEASGARLAKAGWRA